MKKRPVQQAITPISSTPFTSREYIKKPILAQLVHPHAQVPHKTHVTDIGYDVTLIERCDGKTEDLVGEVTLFDTGLRIQPPYGYYLELLPRSSLYKKGYMLVNSVGILDPDYRGNVIAALYKFKDGEDLSLPARCMQFVLRKAEYAYMGLSDTDFEDTERGDGGFGSTDSRNPRSGANMPVFEDEEVNGVRKAKLYRKKPVNHQSKGGGSFYS